MLFSVTGCAFDSTGGTTIFVPSQLQGDRAYTGKLDGLPEIAATTRYNFDADRSHLHGSFHRLKLGRQGLGPVRPLLDAPPSLLPFLTSDTEEGVLKISSMSTDWNCGDGAMMPELHSSALSRSMCLV